MLQARIGSGKHATMPYLTPVHHSGYHAAWRYKYSYMQEGMLTICYCANCIPFLLRSISMLCEALMDSVKHRAML
jgi:hypothetical protein